MTLLVGPWSCHTASSPASGRWVQTTVVGAPSSQALSSLFHHTINAICQIITVLAIMPCPLNVASYAKPFRSKTSQSPHSATLVRGGEGRPSHPPSRNFGYCQPFRSYACTFESLPLLPSPQRALSATRLVAISSRSYGALPLSEVCLNNPRRICVADRLRLSYHRLRVIPVLVRGCIIFLGLALCLTVGARC